MMWLKSYIMLQILNKNIPKISNLTINKLLTRAVRGSDYSPAIVLSEEKDKISN